MEPKQQTINVQEKEKENVNNNPAKKETIKKNSDAIAKFTDAQKIVFSAKKSFENSNEHKMNFNREANFAVQILESNPFLMKANPTSIKNAIVNVSLIGLSLNPALKYAYLVPRNGKDELNLILDISYMGLIKLLTDAGAIKNIDCDIICENDKYDFRKGSEPYLKHSIALINRGNPIGAYAIAYFRDGGNQFIILNKEEIEKVRGTSESWKNENGRKYSPWETWTEEMWKKTALKRLFKLLPKTKFSEKLIAAISNEHDNEMNDIAEEKNKYDDLFEDTIQDAEEVK